MLAARVEQKNGTYLHSIQRDRRSLPHPAGVAMFGINPDRRSHQLVGARVRVKDDLGDEVPELMRGQVDPQSLANGLLD